MAHTAKATPTLDALPGHWDLIVIGGGITGGGIFSIAARLGLKVLLLEQQDFAWGTSSRSGKLVHGGLRYLKQGRLKLTHEAVRERERLLRQAPGLVEPLGFLFPMDGKHPLDRALYGCGLTLYDLLAGRRTHRYHRREAFNLLAPHLQNRQLTGGYAYRDASADDARMVLRLIFSGMAAGGSARNYTPVISLLKNRSGQVNGVVAQDLADGTCRELHGKAVISATGVWADQLRAELGAAPSLRPLRGSHLIFPGWRFPLAQAIGFPHPRDRRPVYAFPWEGQTLIGTTDLDHRSELGAEPAISSEERGYLLEAIQYFFPRLELQPADITATFAGIRPVIDSGCPDPSRESREMVLCNNSGLITVTGGKLTTFRLMALAALRKVRHRLPIDLRLAATLPAFAAGEAVPTDSAPQTQYRRLYGRHGERTATLLASVAAEELSPIAGTPYLWAELRHALRHEHVRHLDDLLLRRLRLGLLLADGGLSLLPRLQQLTTSELGWSEPHWQREVVRYRQLLQQAYR